MSNYWNTLSPIHKTLTKGGPYKPGYKPQLSIHEKGGRVALKEGGNGKWIQKAIDPKHKGYCTPMTKPTCTPRRKALAKRFKPGGDLHKG
jgi:hypothetical protein